MASPVLSTPLVLNNNNNELNLISCGCAHVFTQSRRTCRAPLDAKPRPTLQGSHGLTTRLSDWVILGQHADRATPCEACGPGSSVSAITVRTTRRDGTARAGDGRGWHAEPARSRRVGRPACAVGRPPSAAALLALTVVCPVLRLLQ